MTLPGSLKKTPLHGSHVALGARMVEFGGWEMPVFYSSILKEHAAVRTAAGLFDISHMGEFRVSGPESEVRAFLNHSLTNKIDKVKVDSSQYSILLNEEGGVIDDLFIYRISDTEYLLVVNASMIEEDLQVLQKRLKSSQVSLVDESAQTMALALQGPRSAQILDLWIPGASSKLGHHEIKSFESAQGKVRVARTGYTGEDGFEILGDASAAASIWDSLLQHGGSHGLLPCGLGARDTLRMEVCYPLNGHELGPTITPLEAGLGFAVDLEKPEFVGKPALLKQKQEGLKRRSVALKAEVGTPPFRAGYGIFVSGTKAGELTSGAQSPSLGVSIGLGLIDAAAATVGNSVDIEVRGKYFPATIVKKPIYKKT
jgi:aminomethyltransferase